ncbi:helix-turn-helix domain-containing protein [Dactylosporangium sp. AC04546]|uniref:winged helix-turn-helix transcriptional regulator n=1 Tax=Dactylosporangium sp. AC04546 TaxID=2862460 RepID=UPI001EE04AA4|nr:helix-turn-helix domain-containing protein [Dactylosporangium sp. AC04546]WVK81403.1 helix-turn-helix domain-containing protein [Dactylosporangium sp. AC04546]
MTTAVKVEDHTCRAFQPAVEFLGRRWVGVVLLAGREGARRFGQYRQFVTGISDRLLAQRLRELEQHGLVERTVVPSTPVQVLYAPTKAGLDLLDALEPLIAWSLRHPEVFGND